MNMSFPSGSATKQPSTGYGSPSFFGGFTFNRMYNNWFGFTSEGVTLTTVRHGTKFGNTFLYQFGLGKNIFSQCQNIIIDGIFELDGAYNQKSRIDGSIDPDSGGNMINFTPSLWISSPNYIFQLGVGFPVVQQLNGEQLKMHYLVAANLAYTLR